MRECKDDLDSKSKRDKYSLVGKRRCRDAWRVSDAQKFEDAAHTLSSAPASFHPLPLKLRRDHFELALQYVGRLRLLDQATRDLQGEHQRNHTPKCKQCICDGWTAGARSLKQAVQACHSLVGARNEDGRVQWFAA